MFIYIIKKEKDINNILFSFFILLILLIYITLFILLILFYFLIYNIIIEIFPIFIDTPAILIGKTCIFIF